MNCREEINIDLLNNYDLIKSKERVTSHGEVLTPEWLVNDMLDLLPKSVSKINSRYLEASAGEGAFLVEVLRRKLTTIFNMYSEVSDREYYTIVAICNIYGLELLKDNVEIAKTRLELLIKDFFANQNNISTSNSFFDIVKMILNINIINMDSMEFREPIFDDKNQIVIDEKGKLTYKSEWALISEWEFDNDKKEVKRIEYYYKDVVNKQRETYLLKKKEKELNEISNYNNLIEDDEKEYEAKEKHEQLSLFTSSSDNVEIKLYEENENINSTLLNPVRVFESVNYLKLLDLK
ncbi:MAG: hypothetical protein KIB00_09580 [Paeniclostridium sordellii]|nr:hypothetical protein [Paeniclostridium sordellii]